MKAFAITARDAVPAVVDVPDAVPGPGEITLAVRAASINGFDLAVAGGMVWEMLPHSFPVVIGRDFAGTVEAVGEGVDATVGALVAGVNTKLELGPGPIAERFTVDAASVADVPEGVTEVQAAGAGLAAVAALDLVDALRIGAGDKVLILGGTGGVGSFAIQLAAARGAQVLATARPGAASDFVRSLGASDAVDYSGDLSAAVRAIAPDGVNKVIHAAGDPAELAAALAPGATVASTLNATAEAVGRNDVDVVAVMAAYTPAKLTQLLDLVAAGQLRVEVADVYPLADAADALATFRTGKLGKLVVTP
jgi:NADPH:quinone reductase-like Zn-dependent oxidoreductase